jgi:hypothetical protein
MQINNSVRAAFIDREDAMFQKWRTSGLDKRHFIYANKSELDRAITADRKSPKPRRAPDPAELRPAILEALSKVETAYREREINPGAETTRSSKNALLEFGRLWPDVKLVLTSGDRHGARRP